MKDLTCKLNPEILQHPHEAPMLTAQTKVIVDNAIAAAQPRRLAAEFLAHCIITNPDDYPADMLEAARIVLAPVVLKGVGVTYHPPLSRNDLEKKYGQPS